MKGSRLARVALVCLLLAGAFTPLVVLGQTGAGLTAPPDYRVAEGALAEANATASIVASAAARACGSTVAENSTSGPFAQACAGTESQTAAAMLHLRQAATVLAHSSGHENSTVGYSDSQSLISAARSELGLAASDLEAVASYSYSQRGNAYVDAVLMPISAKANATIRSETSFQAGFDRLASRLSAYAASQATAVNGVATSVSTLSQSILLVDASAVSSNVSSSQASTTAVTSDMNDLLAIPGIAALASVVGDIHSCSNEAASYNSSLANARSQSDAFTQAQVSSFSAYLSAFNGDAASVQNSGSAYVESCQAVINDLKALLNVPGVQGIYNGLVALNLTGGTSSTNASLVQVAAAMATVQMDIGSASSEIAQSRSSILVNASLAAEAASLSAQGPMYLNVTAATSLDQTAYYTQTVSTTSLSFMSSANATLQGTMGAVASSSVTVLATGSSLLGATSGEYGSALWYAELAHEYIMSDVQARSSDVTSANTEITHALQLFSGQSVPEGVAAMAQAYLTLEAAAAAPS